MGGLLGMVVAKAYGDRMMEAVFPGLVGQSSEDESTEESEEVHRPRRRYKFRRNY